MDASIALQQLYVVGILQGNGRITHYLSQLAAVMLEPATASTDPAMASMHAPVQRATPPTSTALAPMPLQLSISFGAAAMQVLDLSLIHI